MPTTFKRVLLSYSLLMLLAGLIHSTSASAEEASPAIGSSFKVQGLYLDKPAPVEATVSVEPKVKANDPSAHALRWFSSFPARIQFGDHVEFHWPLSAVRTYKPAPVEVRFKVSACSFAIVTGGFTLSDYKNQDGKQKVANDVLAPSSTVQANGDGAFLNVDSELYVRIDTAEHEVCKRVFAGHRPMLGRATLAGTKIRAISDSGLEAPSVDAGISDTADIYLVWDDQLSELRAENAVGLPVSVRSSITHIMPTVADQYYLTADIHLAVIRPANSHKYRASIKK